MSLKNVFIIREAKVPPQLLKAMKQFASDAKKEAEEPSVDSFEASVKKQAIHDLTRSMKDLDTGVIDLDEINALLWSIDSEESTGNIGIPKDQLQNMAQWLSSEASRREAQGETSPKWDSFGEN